MAPSFDEGINLINLTKRNTFVTTMGVRQPIEISNVGSDTVSISTEIFWEGMKVHCQWD